MYHSIIQYMLSTCCVLIVISNQEGSCTSNRQVKGLLFHGLYSAGSQVGAPESMVVPGLRPKGRAQLSPKNGGCRVIRVQQVQRSRVRIRLSCSRQ